jgi:hypothetical protein
MDAATQRAVGRTRSWPRCQCLAAQDNNKPWRELKLHREVQDTDCDGWKRLLDLVDECAADGTEVFEPGAHLRWEDWIKITTLPASIGKLTRVKELRLYGSYLVRIPPEIGDMQALEVFDIYTSYRLHWLPFEITRCANLKKSRISTRALYGNYKYRPPFPRLRGRPVRPWPQQCSVCCTELGSWQPIQVWISLNIATDVAPLLVHACSWQCIGRLPTPAPGYVQTVHRGGVGVAQPSKGS